MKWWLLLAWLVLSPCVSASESLRQTLEALLVSERPRVNGEPVFHLPLLVEFYQQRQFEPVWVRAGQLSGEATALLAAVRQVTQHGLLPADYHASGLARELDPLAASSGDELELLLSDALVQWARHLKQGKVDPVRLTSDWRAKIKGFDGLAVLQAAAGGESVAAIGAGMLPKQVRYARLQTALEDMRQLAIAFPDTEWRDIPGGGVIKPGMSDPRLGQIQDRLRIWGDYAGADSTPEAIHDSLSVAAVEGFQRRHGLEVDGIIGAATLKALNVSPQQRLRTVTVNLERWRWLDETFGSHFVVVNIAAYDLRVYQDGQRVFETRVIVGKRYRKSPVFSDRIRYIVFNPTWTVPHKLAVQDKLQEIQRNPEYLNKMGFSVYPAGGKDALDPTTVPWRDLTQNNFPYRLVQAPGPLNALGQVKFMFPNEFDVYLHDTPARDLFAQNERAFSSGCIRVSNPLGLADHLLAPQGWTSAQTVQVIEAGQTKTVFLREPVPVHIEYWTAWVDRYDKLHFRPDIYARDAPLYDALSTPLVIESGE